MIRNRIFIFAPIALFAAATSLRAQESSSAATVPQARADFPDPALDALVAEALRNNTEISAAAAAVEAARSRIEPARTLPDPSLSFNYQNDGRSPSLGREDMTFLGATFTQAVPWPGKLKLAGEEARNRAEEVKEGVLGRALLSVQARVRRAYYEYLLAKEQGELIEDRGRSWRQISDTARQRYAAGLGVQQDMLRAQVEVLRLDEARAEQIALLASRRAEINRALGRPQDAGIETAGRLTLRADVPDLPSLLRLVSDRSPELAGVSRAVEAARFRAALAKKNLLPDFVASGGPMYRGGLDPMWQVGLGVSLPVFAGSRQRPLLASALSDVRAEEARVSSTRQELEFRTRERFESLTAAVRIARLYNEGVLPVDQLSLDSAIASYRTGKVPFVTVLDALNTLYADRALYLTRLAESEKWRVAIDEADLQAGAGMAAAATPPAPSGFGSSGAGSTSSMR